MLIPGRGEGVIYTEHATSVHGLNESHPSIRDADEIVAVWHRFCEWIRTTVARDEVIVLVAYNGATCDLKWLWRMTQAPRSQLCLPANIKYFIDPLRVIKNYKGCKLNPAKSKLDSLELGCVWKHLHNGAHDSLVDVRAQSDVILHPSFIPYIDRSFSIQTIDLIFTATQQNAWKKDMEPLRPVHDPWIELSEEADVTWSPRAEDTYTGVSGGGLAAPTSGMSETARKASLLTELFLFLLPLKFFETVAIQTKKYCYEDWVTEKFASTRDGGTKDVRHFVQVPRYKNGKPFPGRRHRGDKEKKRFKITAGYIICWFAALMLQGAHFGTYKPPATKLWRESPYGIRFPYLQNAMTSDAYTFMRRFIHFSDSTKRKGKGSIGFDPLYKVRYPLDVMMKGMRSAWNAGKHVTIDESMIRYMGRAVSYVQYIPAKPIKHGIKVFALCCAI